MIPPPFRYFRPASAAEAALALDDEPGAAVLGGGQTLINALKLDLVSPSLLVDVSGLDELRGVRVTDAEVWIGAAATYAELAADPELQATVPWLAATSGRLVDRQVRNRGTIAGNCCLNDPSSNFPPLLAALDASFDLLGVGGSRTVHSDDFFLGTLITEAALSRSVVTGIRVPRPRTGTHMAERAVLVGADSWAIARAVVRLDVDGSGADAVVVGARVRLGCVFGAPLALPAVEAALVGRAVTADLSSLAAEAVAGEDAEFMGDIHGSAEYRRHLATVQVKRAVDDVVDDILEGADA